MEAADLPFRGVNVVDVTEGAQGPFAASLLAELGASVLKIERPGGEMMRRGYGRPQKRGAPLPILSIARGRAASVELDLASPPGRDELLRLVRLADVFIENWKPGTASALGLSYEELTRENAGLIYLSASGFGPAGPFAHLGSRGHITAASGGLASVSGALEELPEHPRIALLDFISAMVTGEMAIAAIVLTKGTGRGVHAETSQLESAIAGVAPVLTAVDSGTDPFGGGPGGASDRWVVPSSIFPCAAGGYAAIHAETDAQWRALTSVLNIQEEPAWETAEGRWRDAAGVEARIAEATRDQDAEALTTRLHAEGVPASVVRRFVGDALNDRKLSDEHVAWRHAGDSVGWIALAQPPWKFSQCDVRAAWPCPPLGAAVAQKWPEEWQRNADELASRGSG